MSKLKKFEVGKQYTYAHNPSKDRIFLCDHVCQNGAGILLFNGSPFNGSPFVASCPADYMLVAPPPRKAEGWLALYKGPMRKSGSYYHPEKPEFPYAKEYELMRIKWEEIPDDAH